MLAVKAKYDNGTVRWRQKPQVAGLHDVLVVFADVDEMFLVDDIKNDPNRSQMDEAIAAIRQMYSDIPKDVSLADELIAERRREAMND